MGLFRTLSHLASPPASWVDRWSDTQVAVRRWAETLEQRRGRASELGNLIRNSTLGDGVEKPVIDLGNPAPWRHRIISGVISVCAVVLIVGGISAFFWGVLHFSLLLVLVSKGLGLRVHLPDVFQTP